MEMSPERQILHRTFANALGCGEEANYPELKDALIAYLKCVRPGYFALSGGRKGAFEHMARMEGITVEEKLEDFALLDYVMRRSFAATTVDEALATLSTSGILDTERVLAEKVIRKLFS